MTFEEALKLLNKGHRIISKKDKETYDQQGLNLNPDDHETIQYMNEPWIPTPNWLLDCINDEWIDVENDPYYK